MTTQSTTTTDATVRELAQRRSELNERVRKIVAEGLDLPVPPEFIEDDQPLFGRGLELDSLDTLEVVSLIEEEFGVYITDDSRVTFGSINKLADHISLAVEN